MAKAKAKAKVPAKKAAPASSKKPAAKVVDKPAQKTSGRRPPRQTDIEDDGVIDLRSALAGCPMSTIIECLLDETARRVNILVEEAKTDEMAACWMHMKRLEKTAEGVRRAMEDALVIALEDEAPVDETREYELGAFKTKIKFGVTRKVDAEALTELSEEYDIEEQIGRLFRFKPELNLTAYRNEDEGVQEFFNQVITTTPSRPAFTITAEDGE